jgi:hypothetical protein
VTDHQPHQVNPKAWHDPATDRYSVSIGYVLAPTAYGHLHVSELPVERDGHIEQPPLLGSQSQPR